MNVELLCNGYKEDKNSNMVIRNAGNAQAVNTFSDTNHDLVATSTVPNIDLVFIFYLHKYLNT